MITTIASADDARRGYHAALVDLSQTFSRHTENAPLFTTDSGGLWGLFLHSLPDDVRQHYNCHACRHFIERFGGLAIVVDGRVVSPLWSLAAGRRYVDGLDDAFQALAREVSRAKITGVFLSDKNVLGAPVTGEWHHFRARLVDRHISRSKVKTSDQAMAEKREEYAMLCSSFGDFSLATVRTAHELLTSGRLYRSEKCQGVAKWLLDLHEARRSTGNRATQANMTWLAVADAPAGWCHVRSGMIGTLLEDIEAGMDFDAIKRRFDEKMNPLQYMRPTAQPSAGNIAQAEKIVAQLESAGALARRFARLEEVEALWLPKSPAEPKPTASSPVFGHLLEQAKPPQGQVLPPVTMTWVKFRDTVLPTASSIEYEVRPGSASYCGLTTAVNSDAPPILQWDREDRRNPVSWYLYSMGSLPASWNLSIGWRRVTAVTPMPCHWYNNRHPSVGPGIIAILEGCHDTGNPHSGLFPETLRSDYHAIRRTMEAYSSSAKIEGKDEATACGIMLAHTERSWQHTFRVTTTTGMVAAYNLDRWD